MKVAAEIEVIHFYALYIFLIKQPTRCTNYPNLFCYKTLHVSGILSAHHQEFSAVHMAMELSSILTLPGGGHQKPARNLPVYSRKLLMMGREDARNMQSFITE